MIKKKVHFHFLLTIIILFNCISYYHGNVVGIYESMSDDYYHSLRVYNDSSYVFILSGGLSSDTLSNSWERKGNTLILKLAIHNPVYFIDYSDTCSSIHLGTYAKNDSQPIPAYFKTYNNNITEIEGFIDINGKVNISQKIDSIYITCLGFKSLGIKIEKNKCNIEAFLPENDADYIQFLQQDWIIKKNEIMSSNGLVLRKVTKFR
ncbi:hypothetical protein JW948_11590 [bacterium]|nr:hypothetical protein [bacterium]